ncbi:peptide/nickel transport system permease protein [Catalinimonas alkaloidigena]|uniref:Peptide/nickel transport system permease protein n=1 Tax=Catalinimonas alkaloidigena TaxID=1075417 RepID=A0A1G9Q1V8_9BACT|nr:ABC transporter permease [Catalinimonas alkaloidigena]SDM04976.1 peptide/nickel transport system permease protein [Catalinimonas alkaloidigena]
MKRITATWHWYEWSAAFFLMALLSTALLADFVANPQPLLVVEEGAWRFPAFEQPQASPEPSSEAFVMRAPIPYDAQAIDREAGMYRSPAEGAARYHWLGTDSFGRDVLAGLVYGSRISLFVSLAGILIATGIGVVLGGLAGFWGEWRLARATLLSGALAIVLLFFYGIYRLRFVWFDLISRESSVAWGEWGTSLALCVGCGLGCWGLGRWFQRFAWGKRPFSIPVDALVSRLIEVVIAIPKLFLLLAFVAIFPTFLWVLPVLLGCTGWMNLARLVRAEAWAARHTGYAESARMLGFSQTHIFFREVLPNLWPTLSVALAFGTAEMLLLESTLAFLRIGTDASAASWGALLAESRSQPAAWWLAVFPGLLIFLTIVSLRTLGDALGRRHRRYALSAP